jgi:hypothetical protein
MHGLSLDERGEPVSNLPRPRGHGPTREQAFEGTPDERRFAHQRKTVDVPLGEYPRNACKATGPVRGKIRQDLALATNPTVGLLYPGRLDRD